MSASTVYLRNLLESKNILDRALLMNQSFPCSPFHSELQKQKAEKLLKDNEFHNGFAHLVDSHCVSLRHAAVNAHRDKLAKKKISKSNTVAQEGNEDSKAIHQLDQSFQFSKANFPKFLYSLPPEWTIVHISEIWQGYESLKMQGFGPPPIAYSLPKLIIARFHGGHTGSLLTRFIDEPAGGLLGESLLAELHSILEGNRTVNKDFRGNRDMYWKLKQEHHDQLKVLVNSLENWWLGFWKCLLIGELSDPTDIKLLSHTTSSVVDLLKKMKRILTSDEEASIRLLISCFCYLNHQQLVRGLLKILNTTVRSPIMQEVLSLFKNVQPDLEKFKTAKRNPVILVLDKVIQQLPWESIAMLSTTPVSRIPSLHFLNSLTWKHSFDRPNPSPTTELKLRSNGIEVNPKLAYYIINPGQDLPGVQLRLQPILEKIWGKQCGLSGAVPVEQEIKQSLMERDIFLYCGHGSGSKYFPMDNLVKLDCRAAPILMGCSSGQLAVSGRIADPTGAPIYYLLAGWKPWNGRHVMGSNGCRLRSFYHSIT
ncbi:separase-like [Daphnia pulex]|uniref:separase-like n=1 Tax=Daphnia pulex TaxID=6669 RepID=UPI001EE022D3|nr:separase-like [Daphnia pulex]